MEALSNIEIIKIENNVPPPCGICPFTASCVVECGIYRNWRRTRYEKEPSPKEIKDYEEYLVETFKRCKEVDEMQAVELEELRERYLIEFTQRPPPPPRPPPSSPIVHIPPPSIIQTKPIVHTFDIENPIIKRAKQWDGIIIPPGASDFCLWCGKQIFPCGKPINFCSIRCDIRHTNFMGGLQA